MDTVKWDYNKPDRPYVVRKKSETDYYILVRVTSLIRKVEEENIKASKQKKTFRH